MASKSKKYENFLARYPNSGKLTADKFAQIWEHYDFNESGYIDEDGLDKFFKDLLLTMTKEEVTPIMVKDMKDCFMSAYDDAGDGRIGITELANILPTDENFILLFRREEKLCSSAELMQLWRKYDQDKSGYINQIELKSFIKDLLEKKGKTATDEKLEEYSIGMLTIFDRNEDERLGLKEMARLLSLKPHENFLTQFEIKTKTMSSIEKRQHFEKIFEHYDKGKSGAIEGDEIDEFVRDLMEPDREDISARELEMFKHGILANCDINDDGIIQRDELRLCLGLYLSK